MYVFVSCWTDKYKESLPFWNMYTPNMGGVRIKLPMPIFDYFDIKDRKETSFFREEEIIHPSFFTANLERILKIQYTDDKDKLHPNIITKLYGKFEGYEGLKTPLLGNYKHPMWRFENEWRFRFYITPFPDERNPDGTFNMNKYTEGIDKRWLGFDSYYLKISDKSFKKMEITLGPKINPGDKEIVEALIAKFNPTAKLCESYYKGKIR